MKRDHITKLIGGDYHHRRAVNQLREVAAAQRADARALGAGLASYADAHWLVDEDGNVADGAREELEQIEMLVRDARDIEKIAVKLARNQTRAAFRLFDSLDTAVRDTVAEFCPTFWKMMEKDAD